MNSEPLTLLREHEEAVSKLYNAYASKFKEHEEFWATLSWEELDHAQKIQQISELIEKGNVRFDPTKFKSAVINTSMAYIARELTRLKTEPVSMENALSIALSIEKSIIDGGIFDAFTGFTTEAKSLIRELATSFNEHYQAVQKVWTEHRRF
jgi:hypothetical protein